MHFNNVDNFDLKEFINIDNDYKEIRKKEVKITSTLKKEQ